LSNPNGADEEAMTILSDILPTGFERGAFNGKVAQSHCSNRRFRPDRPPSLPDRQLYSPTEIIPAYRIGLAPDCDRQQADPPLQRYQLFGLLVLNPRPGQCVGQSLTYARVESDAEPPFHSD
jgi:hypothetical protein